MKVLLVNGSPHLSGSTHQSLTLMAQELNAQGIETEIFSLKADVLPCRACYVCKKNGRCVQSDQVNEFVDKMEKYLKNSLDLPLAKIYDIRFSLTGNRYPQFKIKFKD